MKRFILDLLDRVLEDVPIRFGEARRLLEVDRDEFLLLAYSADRIRRRFCGDKIDLCSIINAKSGMCLEDCKFCAQSSFYNTDCKVYPLLSSLELLEAARNAKRIGAQSFCIVTSGLAPEDEEFQNLKNVIRKIRDEVDIDVDCSLGRLTEEMMKELKALGIKRFNHNLETSRGFFDKVCTTHSFEDRYKTVQNLRALGIEACTGGIIGLGEAPIDRIELAFHLKVLGVECIPINILNPRPGTPLENQRPLSIFEILKTIAIFRFILPKSVIKIAGGREFNLRDFQAMSFLAGANGMIIGGYLTTRGRPVEQDLQMIKDLSSLPRPGLEGGSNM